MYHNYTILERTFALCILYLLYLYSPTDFLFVLQVILSNVCHIIYRHMTDPVKKVKDASQDAEAKVKTSEDHAEGKPSSETVNKAKVKVRDALT
jgi:hypothetical protein